MYGDLFTEDRMYRLIYKEQNEEAAERYTLAIDRIREIPEETDEKYAGAFFRQTAAFIGMVNELLVLEESGGIENRTLAECREWNERLFGGLSPENYQKSFANPDYAASVLPEEYASLLCFLSSELYALIPYAFEGRKYDMTILLELYLELYGIFENAKRDGEEVKAAFLQEAVETFYHDYAALFAMRDVQGRVDPDLDFFTKIVMESDLSKPEYLYRYGAYIGENEEKISVFLSTLPEDEIRLMAKTIAEGYRKGFEMTGKDISKKRYVTVEYQVGFERIVRELIDIFKELGLQSVIYREAVNSFQGMGKSARGCYAKSLNRQYLFDHKNDRAYYLTKEFNRKRIESLRSAFEAFKEKANLQGGPAVLETFGEEDFAPVMKKSASAYSEVQNELTRHYMSEAGRITNEYIIGEERSFTCIAFPLPSIGEQFGEIFAETEKLNTLDYEKYLTMQQKLIDVLDRGEKVRIRGAGANETDMTVVLQTLADPEKETDFENCVADVNIPVGEVFTSPVLSGTEGVLHVSRVYLNGFRFEDLKLTFRDGMITDYTCGNFDKEEENRRYIYENILMQHESLPIGEFAIGTNTTAYRMARTYEIESKLPILIAEKTGPHFAVGDTCYSHEEELVTYNPNGKAIIAKENEVSALRKSDPGRAYLNCHTDITIPFDELLYIRVVQSDGSEESVIEDGRFVVPGTEELNESL